MKITNLGRNTCETLLSTDNLSLLLTVIHRAGLVVWWENLVGLGSDIATTSQGVNSKDLAASFQKDFPWVVSIQCIAHRLETTAADAVKEEDMVKELVSLLEGIYDMYVESPRLFRKFPAVADVLELRASGTTKGNPWSVHIRNALQALHSSFQSVVARLEEVVEEGHGSEEMRQRAKDTLNVLKDYQKLKFSFFLEDVLDHIDR